MYLKFGEFCGEVHERDCDDLRLPLEAERRAERVVDEGPRHLHHLLQLGRVALALQAFRVLDQAAVRVVHRQVELDGLQVVIIWAVASL